MISFASLILGNMALILTSLSKTRFVIHVLLERNIALLAILGIASILLFSMIYVPYLRDLFAFGSPGGIHFWIVFVAVFVLITILEFFKLSRIRKNEAK